MISPSCFSHYTMLLYIITARMSSTLAIFVPIFNLLGKRESVKAIEILQSLALLQNDKC